MFGMTVNAAKIGGRNGIQLDLPVLPARDLLRVSIRIGFTERSLVSRKLLRSVRDFSCDCLPFQLVFPDQDLIYTSVHCVTTYANDRTV